MPDAVKLQGAIFADQAEFHRVPVKPRQLLQRVESLRAQSADAVGLHIVGEHRIGEQRHVPEDVVEDVRFLQIVELGRACG